jgi:siroheme synthase-like protein
MTRYFPLALDLEGRSCLVIGGADEAVRRARALLEAGALLSIVAEAPCPELRALAAAHSLTIAERPATGSDFDGRWLAVVAERDRVLAQALGAEAEARRVFFCAVDVPSAGSYAHMAQARAGIVTAAISTSGKAPALGRKLSLELARLFAESGLSDFADSLAALREVTASPDRARVLGDAVAGVHFDGKLRLRAWIEQED